MIEYDRRKANRDALDHAPRYHPDYTAAPDSAKFLSRAMNKCNFSKSGLGGSIQSKQNQAVAMRRIMDKKTLIKKSSHTIKGQNIILANRLNAEDRNKPYSSVFGTENVTIRARSEISSQF